MWKRVSTIYLKSFKNPSLCKNKPTGKSHKYNRVITFNIMVNSYKSLGGKIIKSRQKGLSYVHTIYKRWNAISWIGLKKSSISISDYQWGKAVRSFSLIKLKFSFMPSLFWMLLRVCKRYLSTLLVGTCNWRELYCVSL